MDKVKYFESQNIVPQEFQNHYFRTIKTSRPFRAIFISRKRLKGVVEVLYDPKEPN